MRIIGSQARETLEEAGAQVVGKLPEGDVLVLEPDSGPQPIKVYTPNDHHAGYTLEIEGVGHEFVRSATCGDLWWVDLNSR